MHDYLIKVNVSEEDFRDHKQVLVFSIDITSFGVGGDVTCDTLLISVVWCNFCVFYYLVTC